MNSLHPKLRQNRNQVRLAADVTRSGGDTQEVVVDDLSIDGCAVRGYFRVGETVIMRFPRIGTFTAEVRWAGRGRAGLRFARHASL